MRSSQRLSSLFLLLFALGAGLLLFFFLQIGWQGYISDSEIWSVNLGKNVGSQWYHPWVCTRPLFYGALALVELGSRTAVGTFLAAKTLFLANGLAIVLLTFAVSRRLRTPQSPTAHFTPWFAILLLLSNTGFLNQGYRIRSDLLACSLQLAVLYVMLGRVQLPFRRNFLLLWFVPLLATPKAVLLAFPLVAFVPSRRELRLLFEVALVAAVSVALIYPSGTGYFARTIVANLYNDRPYEYFFYVKRLLNKNVLFFALFALRGLCFAVRWRRGHFTESCEGESQLRFAAYTLISALLCLANPQKVPFLLATYLPTFSLFAALLAEDIFALCPTPAFRRGSAAGAGILALTLVTQSYQMRQEYFDGNSNEYEFEAIRALDQYLAQYPLAEYYDVVGLVPNRATRFFFAGPDDPETNVIAAELLAEKPPELLFYVQKARFLEPRISALIHEKYFPLGQGVYARWEKVPAPAPKRAPPLAAIAAQVKAAQEALGAAASPSFSALLQRPGKPPYRAQVTIAELVREKKLRVLAISPLLDLPKRFAPLYALVRFDTEY